MKTVSLNAELLRQLSYIADDELYLRKALNSIKRLVAQKEKEEEMACADEAAEECRPQTKAEILAGVDEAFKELKAYKEGKLQLMTLDEALHELHD